MNRAKVTLITFQRGLLRFRFLFWYLFRCLCLYFFLWWL